MVSDLASAFPSDVPDLREATNHLAPLTLPAQICMYFPGKEGRIGVEVCHLPCIWLSPSAKGKC